MNASGRRWVLLLAAWAALTGACGDGGDLGVEPGIDLAQVAPVPAPLCERVCDARQVLACPRAAPDCAHGCAEAVSGSCGPQWTRYFSCFADSAPGQRVCSALGQPDLAPGVCASEHGDVQRCLIAALSGS